MAKCFSDKAPTPISNSSCFYLLICFDNACQYTQIFELRIVNAMTIILKMADYSWSTWVICISFTYKRYDSIVSLDCVYEWAKLAWRLKTMSFKQRSLCCSDRLLPIFISLFLEETPKKPTAPKWLLISL